MTKKQKAELDKAIKKFGSRKGLAEACGRPESTIRMAQTRGTITALLAKDIARAAGVDAPTLCGL